MVTNFKEPKKRGLGRGLEAFLDESPQVQETEEIPEISLDEIRPNPYQPRKTLYNKSLKDLSESIKENGVCQPIIIRKSVNGYEIIAGERRFRASKLAKKKTIPAIIRDFDEAQMMEVAVLENLQREDLNPIDEAKAYTNLMKLNDLTQTALAKDMGKSQSYVANKLRLLKLDDDVQKALIEGKITARHGRALLNLSEDDQERVLKEIEEKGLNVKQTEEIAKDVDAYFNPKPKETKRERVVKRIPKDLKVQINTIKKAVKLAKDSGIVVKVKEDKNPDDYKITIELKRK